MYSYQCEIPPHLLGLITFQYIINPVLIETSCHHVVNHNSTFFFSTIDFYRFTLHYTLFQRPSNLPDLKNIVLLEFENTDADLNHVNFLQGGQESSEYYIYRLTLLRLSFRDSADQI